MRDLFLNITVYVLARALTMQYIRHTLVTSRPSEHTSASEPSVSDVPVPRDAAAASLTVARVTIASTSSSSVSGTAAVAAAADVVVVVLLPQSADARRV